MRQQIKRLLQRRRPRPFPSGLQSLWSSGRRNLQQQNRNPGRSKRHPGRNLLQPLFPTGSSRKSNKYRMYLITIGVTAVASSKAA